MANRNTSISINGKRYEAQSGSIIGAPSSRSIDGLVRGRPAVPSDVTTQPTVITPTKVVRPDVVRQIASHAKTHTVKPSATLMRRAVQKPESVSLKRYTKVHSSTLALANKPAAITPKTVIHSVNEQRVARAQQASASPRVSKFAPSTQLPVQPATLPIAQSPLATQPVYRPDIVQAPRTAASNDVFERALARANSHEQTAPSVKIKPSSRRSKGKLVAYLSGAAVVLVIAGFASLQLLGGLRFKMASNKAGFAVTMPTYKPTGFSVANLESSAGYFGITFNNTKASFALTEKPSNWNSATLLSNVVGNNQSFDTIESAGRTVYLYGKDQAAWVNNGILYNITNHSSLSSQQLANLVSSM